MFCVDLHVTRKESGEAQWEAAKKKTSPSRGVERMGLESLSHQSSGRECMTRDRPRRAFVFHFLRLETLGLRLVHRAQSQLQRDARSWTHGFSHRNWGQTVKPH